MGEAAVSVARWPPIKKKVSSAPPATVVMEFKMQSRAIKIPAKGASMVMFPAAPAPIITQFVRRVKMLVAVPRTAAKPW